MKKHGSALRSMKMTMMHFLLHEVHSYVQIVFFINFVTNVRLILAVNI